MAYSGFLLKIGNWEFPKSLMQAGSFFAYFNMQVKDPWTDEDGGLHMTPLHLRPITVKFNTKNRLTDTEFAEIMKNISDNYVSAVGRKLYVTAYIQEIDDYVTQLAYLADFYPNASIATDEYIKYSPIEMEFIGGVAND